MVRTRPSEPNEERSRAGDASLVDLQMLGANLRRARRSRGLSLETLSKASGVSRAMICQVELGKSAPTIGVLWKVAVALGVPLDALVSGGSGRCVVLRANSARVVRSQGGAFSSRSLFPSDGSGGVEFYELRLKARAIEHADARPPGSTENLVVTRGSLTVSVRGERFTLERGDAIFFGADAPHEYGNEGEDEVRAYLVTTTRAVEVTEDD
jgi:transcriptional regulator with XRE-family HTH domain